MDKVNNEGKVVNEVNQDKVTATETESKNKNKISLEDLKTALEEDIELKGYIDSLVDKRSRKIANKELEKATKEREAQELRAKEESLKAEYEARIRELEDVIKYKDLLTTYGLSQEFISTVKAETIEETEERIKLIKSLIAVEVEKEVKKRITENPPIPESSEGTGKYRGLWGN